MARRILTAVCLLFGFSTLAAAVPSPLTPHPDAVVTNVTSLPGWDGPLPMEFYSGFVSISSTVPAGTTMNLHYTLHGKEGGTEEGTPLIVWFSGGPGAPSSYGLFVENGPLLTNEQGYTLPGYNATTGTPALVRNPYAWTKFAAVLEFANPPPTGFSYCTPAGPAGHGNSCGSWSDERVGLVNAEGMSTVLTKHFPWLLSDPTREVFIIGESYAGVYISAIVNVLSEPANGYGAVASRIAGVALGDACMGTTQTCGYRGPGDHLKFLYFHAQYPTDMWESLNRNCTPTELRWGLATPLCKESVARVNNAVGNYYQYNLQSNCPNNQFDLSAGVRQRRDTFQHATALHRAHAHTMAIHGSADARHHRAARGVHPPANFNGYWCAGYVFNDYMNLPAVREALGVPVDSFFFIEDDARDMQYNLSLANGFDVWAALLQNKTLQGNPSALTKPFRLMSYNGDMDAAVVMQELEPAWYSFVGNHSYVKSAEWRSWMANGPSVVGGYIVEWVEGRVAFATVRGSGHMVPEYRAHAASVLFTSFVQGKAPQ